MKIGFGRIAAAFRPAVRATRSSHPPPRSRCSAPSASRACWKSWSPNSRRRRGHKLNITWSTAALLAKRVQDGEQADALILIKNNIEALLKDGKIMPGTDTIFTQSIFAVGVKAGAPKPDISTPEAFKKTLLASKAVSYTDPATGGASGVYTAKQIERMGIAEQMKAKSKHPPSGGFSGSLLTTGEADIAINSKPELLSVPGVDVVGPLPGDMAFTVIYDAGRTDRGDAGRGRQSLGEIFDVAGSAGGVQGEGLRSGLSWLYTAVRSASRRRRIFHSIMPTHHQQRAQWRWIS